MKRFSVLLIIVGTSFIFSGCPRHNPSPTEPTTPSVSGTLYYSNAGTVYKQSVTSTTASSLFNGIDPQELPGGRILAVINGNIAIWDPATQASKILFRPQDLPDTLAQEGYAAVLHNPQISSTRRYVAFSADYTAAGGAKLLYWGDTATGSAADSIWWAGTSDGSASYSRPVWTPGNQLYFDGENNTVGIFRIDLHNPNIYQVLSTQAYHPAVSPDGLTGAYILNGHIWTINIATGTTAQLTSSNISEDYPIFSPDGKWIAAEHASQIVLVPIGSGTSQYVNATATDQIDWK